MNHHITTGLMAHAGHTHSRYPATSSAFSASAHPHEDWTKISDLAERRRIQNRIAQRNYRKKLKRRLEDLEAKAASTSASPEQQPAQLSQKSPVRRKISHEATSLASSTPQRQSSGNSSQSSHQMSLSDLMTPNPSMFGEQFSRPISDSPSPTLSYPMTTSGPFSYSPFTTAMQYPAATSSYDALSYSYDPYPSSYASAPTPAFSAKHVFYPEVDVNAFNFQYIPTPVPSISSNSYSESTPQTPPLSDCHELYIAGSPPESSFLPRTPPMAYKTSPQLTMV